MRRASDVSSADWRSNARGNLSHIFACVVAAFLRAGNRGMTPQFI